MGVGVRRVGLRSAEDGDAVEKVGNLEGGGSLEERAADGFDVRDGGDKAAAGDEEAGAVEGVEESLLRSGEGGAAFGSMTEKAAALGREEETVAEEAENAWRFGGSAGGPRIEESGVGIRGADSVAGGDGMGIVS
jgi:hypothetical protein